MQFALDVVRKQYSRPKVVDALREFGFNEEDGTLQAVTGLPGTFIIPSDVTLPKIRIDDLKDLLFYEAAYGPIKLQGSVLTFLDFSGDQETWSGQLRTEEEV